jgi:glutathione S-transferase
MIGSMSAPHPSRPLRLHRHRLSGHSHRAELMLALLGLPYELVDIDLGGRAHEAPDFLAMNAFGQIPVLQDGDVTLADSNAILVYLAGTYARSHALLGVLQGHLESGAPYLAADHPTIADVALYTYVAHAPEGGVSLADYPAVRAWLGRVEALPGFVPMVPSPVGLNA